ncbi:hypothetical protein Ctob_003904 [Chrysochromulina tobinii]|jgi:hypothetical protein|uniref:Uncharacterized protein n=1 Tax=Chrysochromulina tobinii TaxID=1460289 RepID=A0A0M0JKZ6_9EUKA|nr:hypothetical protein Ctob_003904 [Chrysochromulina tobinii]|eukprot:KOO26933.1 hypothetical protein Ctob_003904 [Chrysochromulina sp. CCMP291]
MLASRMLRRRGMCTFQMNIKAMEKKASALAPSLPAGLKEIAEQGASISEELSKFASERPELYKSVLDAIAKADKPGITATVAVAKDPKACKYTLEGTMLHDLMQNVAKVDRRMKVVGELEVTLTAADKAAIKASQAAMAADMGIEASMISGGIPDKMKLAM